MSEEYETIKCYVDGEETPFYEVAARTGDDIKIIEMSARFDQRNNPMAFKRGTWVRADTSNPRTCLVIAEAADNHIIVAWPVKGAGLSHYNFANVKKTSCTVMYPGSGPSNVGLKAMRLALVPDLTIPS